MTMTEKLRIHREIEEGNRRRIEAHKTRKPIIGQKVTEDRKAFREYMKKHTA